MQRALRKRLQRQHEHVRLVHGFFAGLHCRGVAHCDQNSESLPPVEAMLKRSRLLAHPLELCPQKRSLRSDSSVERVEQALRELALERRALACLEIVRISDRHDQSESRLPRRLRHPVVSGHQRQRLWNCCVSEVQQPTDIRAAVDRELIGSEARLCGHVPLLHCACLWLLTRPWRENSVVVFESIGHRDRNAGLLSPRINP